MRIADVRAYPVGFRLDEALRWGAMVVHHKGGIVVEVETTDGLIGIGEAGFSAEYFGTVGPLVNDQLGPMLRGRDPRDIGALWHDMMKATHMWGRRGVETYALSGIDMALWDLLGRSLDQPVHRLLGTAQESVRAYFAPSLKPAPQATREARSAVDAGYSAIKLRVGPDLREAVELVAAVRGEVGPDVDLMVDANMAYERRGALSLAKELHDLGVRWLEEPILSRSLSQYVSSHRWLADRVDIPLAGGESLLTRYEYVDIFAEHPPFDIVQPDAATVGGISELKRVADMASAWNLACVPHIGCSSGTGIGLLAALQVILSCDNAPLIEVDAYGGIGWDGFLVEPPAVRQGWMVAPDRPGIGAVIADGASVSYALS